MAFFSLAFSNIRRRLMRSMLSLLAMALAAAVLTSGLSMAQGTVATDQWHFRDYFEGDIMVFASGFTLPDGSDASFVRRTIIDSGFNPLLRLYPEFAESGYYAEESWEAMALNSEDISLLLSHPGVVKSKPYLTMPATLLQESIDINLRVLPDGHAWEWADWSGIAGGLATDFDVVLNAYGGSSASLGDIITIEVPFYGIDALGLPYVDWTKDHRTYLARVVGKGKMKTRVVSYQVPGGNGWNYLEQGYLHAPEIYVSEQIWQVLWRDHSGGVGYPPLAVSLTVQDMGTLSRTENILRESYPQWTVLSVPAMVDHAYRYSLFDHFYEAQRFFWEGDPTGQTHMATQEVGSLAGILLFLNAGMLMASQMLAAVAGRRNEIGILKSIGARRLEVTFMILVEAMFVAIAGGVAGFSTVKVAGIHQALTNQLPLLTIAQVAVGEMLLVLGITVATSLVFGVLPAWKISRLTVMEVFRNE